MSNKTITTTMRVNVEAEYKALDKLEKELESIQKKASTIGMNEGNSTELKETLLSVKELKKLYDSRRGDGFTVETSSYKELSKLLSEIIKKADKFGKSLIGLSGSENKELAGILQQADDLRKENQAAGRTKSALTRKYRADVNAETAKLNVVDASGQQIKKYDDLKSSYDQISKNGGPTNPQEQKIVEAFEKLQPIVQKLQETYNTAFNEQTRIIEANRGKIKELDQKAAGIMSGATGAPVAGAPVPPPTPGMEAASAVVGATTSLKDASMESAESLETMKKAAAEASTSTTGMAKASNSATTAVKKQDGAFGKAVKNVISYGTALRIVRGLYNKLIQTVKQMDKALTGMTVVTQLTREQAWNLTGTLQSLAKETGMTSTEIANMTTMYLQQGETLENSLKLTEAAAKAARVAGISGTESINLLTNAMNGFQMSAEQAMDVSDKFAALAAEAATNYEELATALSKVAAQANLAGMSMDFTLGMLTKGIEVTREAPETIGTALKTVISRMREMNDYGETLEDGTDVNRVQAALSVIGVELLDQNRQFRDLEEVLTEVGEKWDTLTTNQQANVAVALAGTRQQSRLIAMMQDFDRTQELVNISMKSAGATAAQHRKYMQGLEGATTALTTSYQQLITNFTSSDFIISFINGGANALEYLAENMELAGLMVTGLVMGLASLNSQTILTRVETWLMSTALKEEILTTKTATLADKESRLELLKKTVGRSAEISALIFETEALKAEIAAMGASTRAHKKSLKSIIATNLGLAAEASAAAIAAAAVKALNKELQATAKSNWIVLIIAAVVALGAAWYAANKESEKGKKVAESIGNLFQSLVQIFAQIMNVLEPVISVLAELVGLVLRLVAIPLDGIAMQMEGLALILEFIATILKTVVNWFERMVQEIEKAFGGEIPEWVRSLLSFATSGGGVLGALGALDRAFGFSEKMKTWTLEDRIESTTAKIEELQNKAYDNRKLADTLDPLLEEYTALSKKAVQTTEDLERIKEIESQIGELDASYLNANGTLNYQKASDAAKKAKEEAKAQTQEAYNLALQNINDRGKDGRAADINDTTKSALIDYWTYQTTQIENVSASAANKISSSFNNAINALNDDQLRSLAASENGYENLYNSIKQFELEKEKILTDDNDSNDGLTEQFALYQKQLQNVPNEAKAAFNSVYSLYAHYADLMSKLNIEGAEQKQFLQALDELQFSEEELEKVYTEYMSATGQSREQAELWFADTIKSAVANGQDVGLALSSAARELIGNREDRGLVNAIEGSVFDSNQEITERFATKTSEAKNIAEFSKKIAEGGLTPEEIRQVAQDYSEIFSDKEKYDKFIAGELTAEELIAEERDAALKEIERKKQVTDINSADYRELLLLEESLKYSHLYSLELWENLASTTKEMAKEARLQSEINELQKEYDKLSGDERVEKAKELVAKYKELKEVYSDIYNDPFYKQAVESGYIVDGKVVMTQDELKNIDSAMAIWLDAHYDVIEEASKADETYLDNLRGIIEQEYEYQKELLEERKESYENYFDAVDSLNEDIERSQNKESLIAQISALSTGTGGNVKQLRKDLLTQLEDLSKEEEEARKQQIRDNALKDIDDHVGHIDQILSSIENGEVEEVEGVAAELGLIPQYAEGGLVDFTGPAWVDGTKTRPEAFLDSFDTANIQALTTVLDSIFGLGLSMDEIKAALAVEDGDISSVNIESINIHTDSLNNDQDFRTAGNLLAREFAKVIQERGLNVNTKK